MYVSQHWSIKFHQKTHEYGLLEDRDLWLFELRLTEKQKIKFLKVVEKLKKRRFPYKFFSKNCAHYTQLLLAETLALIPPPKGSVTPLDVITVLRRKNLIVSQTKIPSISTRLVHQAGSISRTVLTTIHQRSWKELAVDTNWLEGLSTEERFFLMDYFKWRSLKMNRPIEQNVLDGIAELRYLNARRGPGEIATRTYSTRFYQHPYRALKFSGFMGSKNLIQLELRPALHSIEESWRGHKKFNTLELLTIKVSAYSPTSLRLEDFVVFSQLSLLPFSWMSKSPSWMLQAKYSKDSNLVVKCGAGIGLRLPLGVYPFLLATGEINASTESLSKVLGLRLIVIMPSDRWRVGLQMDRFNHPYMNYTDLWLRRDLSTKLAFEFRHKKMEKSQFGFGIVFYL